MTDFDKFPGAIEDWQPPGSAIELQRLQPDGRATLIVRHPTFPFVAEIGPEFGPDSVLNDATLQAFANRYLAKLEPLMARGSGDGLALPAGWTDALQSVKIDDIGPWMRWLAVWPELTEGDSDDDVTRPRLASWNLAHTVVPEGSETAENEAVVMVASEFVPVVHQITLGYGLRVPVSLTPRGSDGGYVMQIRSMTAELPRPPYRSFTEVALLAAGTENWQDAREDSFQEDLKTLSTVLKDDTERIARRLQLEPDLKFQDLRARWRDGEGVPVFDGADLLGRGRGALARRPMPETYGILVRYARREDGDGFAITASRKHALTSHADGPGMAEVFHQDPASWGPPHLPDADVDEYDWSRRRPTRREEALQGYRAPRRIGDAVDNPLETADFRVRNCPRYVRSDPFDDSARMARLPAGQWPNVRRNDFSAISAFCNCRRFFRMIANFGIDYGSVTPIAARKVQVFYRSGMSRGPGRDGQTINARVSLVEPPGEEGADGPPPVIEMHLALGNLSHRARPPADGVPGNRAEPLGIAAGPRWIWHEFGHVLIAAKFGELEFPFVHSVGDGLAAVMADPFSWLADPTAPTGQRLRGYTFPWIFATRRHDRSAKLGWAWNGSLNQRLLNAPLEQRRGFKGYLTEQILSSTLFRLYLVLGGDTVRADGGPAYALRERASLLVQYLVIKAIWSLGPNPEAAEAFEIAMEEADTDLAALDFAPLSELAAPGAAAPTDIWRGGQAHKVVRWAFEAQGMFGPADVRYHNAPGRPPETDIYIPDQRPLREMTGGGAVTHGRGGYVPVSLDWDGGRRWHAGDALSLPGGQLRLTVGNRGRSDASELKLRMWAGSLTEEPAGPDWDLGDRIAWTFASGVIDLAGPLEPGEERVFEVDVAPPDTAVVLVEVSCPGDRANSDTAAGFACAITGNPPTVPRHLADLVANDNNLGLRLL